MIIDVLLLIVGLALLLAGGEGLVRGAVSLANRLGLPPLLIGVTVVGFGTSLPELLVSVQAVLAGSPDIAVGNVVGSNIANMLLILGVSATISPIVATVAGVCRDMTMMLFVAFAVLGLGLWGEINALSGMVMLAILIGYMTAVTIIDRRNHDADEETSTRLKGWVEAVALIGGLAGLFIGADLLIDAATRLARAAGISEAVIGLTIVAVGTSLPELATALVAALRKHAEVALGNIVGSNIFNLFGILAITAIVRRIPIADQIAHFDIPFMVTLSVLLTGIVFMFRRIGRPLGLLMLTTYAGYTAYLFAYSLPA